MMTSIPFSETGCYVISFYDTPQPLQQ